MASEKKDLEIYADIQRYHFAYLIGEAWFQILENMIINIEQLKTFLKDKTLVGEYCGNPKHKHLVSYPKITILFYAIVDHNNTQICLPPKESFELFEMYKIPKVIFQKMGIFSKMEDFHEKIKEIFVNISELTIEEGGEGTVLYFVGLNEKNEESNVISLCKIKTLEYFVYRKIREKLKKFVQDNSKKETLLRKFGKEIEELVGDLKLPKKLSYYKNIMDQLFEQIRKIKNKSGSIQDCFLDLLDEIRGKNEKNLQTTIKNESMSSLVKINDNVITHEEEKKEDSDFLLKEIKNLNMENLIIIDQVGGFNEVEEKIPETENKEILNEIKKKKKKKKKKNKKNKKKKK